MTSDILLGIEYHSVFKTHTMAEFSKIYYLKGLNPIDPSVKDACYGLHTYVYLNTNPDTDKNEFESCGFINREICTIQQYEDYIRDIIKKYSSEGDLTSLYILS